MSTFAESARELRAGGITFGEFVARHGAEWRRAAASLYRAWRSSLPPWYTEDDVMQDMLVGAMHGISRPNFTARAETTEAVAYLMWNAEARARRAMNKARGAGQHRPSGPSRFERCESSLRADDAGDRSPVAVDAGPSPEDLCARREMIAAAIARAESVAEVLTIEALAAECGVLDAAARRLYADPAARLALQAGSERQARRTVRSIAREVVRRATGAA